ncbi:MAG: ABC transporter ATP-binding protein [Thermomicrobiales bacterium]
MAQHRGPAGPGGPGGRFTTEKRRAKDTRGTTLRIWGYLRRRKGALTLAGVLIVCSTALSLVGPYLMGKVIDDAITHGDLGKLEQLVLALIGIYLATSFLTWAQAWVMAGVAQSALFDIRSDLFDRLQVMELRFFDERPHGETMSRLTNDVDNINQVLTESVTQIVSGVLTAVGVIVLMLVINPILAVTAVASTVLLTLGVNRWVGSRTREGFRAQQKELGALNGFIEETVTGQRVVKAYHRETESIADFERQNLELRGAALKAQTFAGFVGPMMNFISNTNIAVVAAVGGILAIQGSASVGTIASFMAYSRQLGRPLNDIANLYNQIQAAIAGAERVFEIIDWKPEVDAPDASGIEIVGDVVFDDVTFSYGKEQAKPTLSGISFHATPGQTIALVGPTGAGKTTIVNLITRFYEIDSGVIRIDGHDLRTLRKDELRRQLGMVLQDSFLFAGTVADNIRYGKLDATDDEVIAAAKTANAHPFIEHLSHGYQTVVTERGGNLSQGQRQLIAIARAVIADPRILILDEATSSVDTRTERLIQSAMQRMMVGRTSFVIAHRLSTIRKADQILVIVGGEIVERGTHAELMAQGGIYAGLNRGSAAVAHEESRELVAAAAAAGDFDEL